MQYQLNILRIFVYNKYGGTKKWIKVFTDFTRSIGTGFVDYGMQLIEKRSENRHSKSDDAVRS